MSFFRNIRTSITRGKSSSRDTTPVRNTTTTTTTTTTRLSRPNSVISTNTNGRRDSMDSRTDSMLNRGETFILGSEEDERNHSNTSTLEKKSKKSKVFGKFSTFTKRKKPPSPDAVSYEHHPSDTATNTYYKWKSESVGNERLLDYDAQSDPFNFLYEQQSSLKSLQSSDKSTDLLGRQASVHSTTSSNGSNFDSGTYRKSKVPTQLREQLEQLKTLSNDDLLENEEDEGDKYKTVTLSSFRKSFRDKFLQQQQQKEAPYSPAWFVEVEAPANRETDTRSPSKENRPDFLVFENDNYRPQSRSPLRERPSRATTRSPVKRNETFRVESPLRSTNTPTITNGTTQPSIRIEIKNSITPNMPGRFVPVGVAKPMPTTEYYAQRLLAAKTASTAAALSKASKSPIRNWYNRIQTTTNHSPTRTTNHNTRNSGRYQTLVQIGNEQSTKALTNQNNLRQYQGSSPIRGRPPTRIQLIGSATNNRTPTSQKRLNSSSSSSLGMHGTPGTTATYSYNDMLIKDASRTTKPKHTTYFGDTQQQHYQPMRTLAGSHININNNYNNNNNNNSQYNTPVNKPLQKQQPYTHSSRSTANFNQNNNNSSTIYLGRRDQQQQHYQPTPTTSTHQQQPQRFALPIIQRRTRSPIKMPWR